MRNAVRVFGLGSIRPCRRKMLLRARVRAKGKGKKVRIVIQIGPSNRTIHVAWKQCFQARWRREFVRGL